MHGQSFDMRLTIRSEAILQRLALRTPLGWRTETGVGCFCFEPAAASLSACESSGRAARPGMEDPNTTPIGPDKAFFSGWKRRVESSAFVRAVSHCGPRCSGGGARARNHLQAIILVEVGCDGGCGTGLESLGAIRADKAIAVQRWRNNSCSESAPARTERIMAVGRVDMYHFECRCTSVEETELWLSGG